jgi:hypothetical protein
MSSCSRDGRRPEVDDANTTSGAAARLARAVLALWRALLDEICSLHRLFDAVHD